MIIPGKASGRIILVIVFHLDNPNANPPSNCRLGTALIDSSIFLVSSGKLKNVKAIAPANIENPICIWTTQTKNTNSPTTTDGNELKISITILISDVILFFAAYLAKYIPAPNDIGNDINNVNINK